MTMGLPPPKLQDLAAWESATSNRAQAYSQEVWEIGVPEKHSLPWSITLAYLFSARNEEFPIFMRQLIGSDEEIKEVKKKKSLSPRKINPDVMKRRLKSFNPFKNRHTFFHQAEEAIEVFRIFDLRLKRFANELRTKTDVWNDDFKLNAASLLLECIIEVYFPDEKDNQKFITYPKIPHDFKEKIVLFQYKDQKHGARRENINVFHFAMTIQQVHCLKLEALVHILKKAKTDNESIGKIKYLMTEHEKHGKCFLPTVMENNLFHILPKIYKSSYIALKLSEAGFETDPIAIHAEKPSALCYAAVFNADPSYFRILYDYASNCRCFFHRSVRRADNDVLETLKQITRVLQRDITKLSACEFKTDSKERAVHILKQFVLFSKYQLKTASDLNILKGKQANLTEFQFRKEVIEVILRNYLSFFLYNKSSKFLNLTEFFMDNIDFSEYYENTDKNAFVTFFDNFYSLRSCIGLKELNVFLKIEWQMILAMISNRYFSKFDHELKYKPGYNFSQYKEKCEKENVLRYIPLMHRRALGAEIQTFLEKLKNAPNEKTLYKALNGSNIANDPHSIPQIIDELLISRLMKHIDAALEVSPDDDGPKAVLVIERALQVLGESIKPPSSSGSIISFLLRAQLPFSLQKDLINIRNELSHYKDYLVHGRFTVENDVKFFNTVKEELERIKACFAVVDFTQFLRLEETVMANFISGFQSELNPEVNEAFNHKWRLRIEERTKEYEKYHNDCLQLLCNSISDLQKHSQNEIRKEVLSGQLKSIDFLLEFMKRNKCKCNLDDLSKAIKRFVKRCEKMEIDEFKNNLQTFLQESINMLPQCNVEKNVKLSAPATESFLGSLKKDLFSESDQECIKEAVRNAWEEADNSLNKLKDVFTRESYTSDEKQMLEKQIPKRKVQMLRKHFESRKTEEALKYLEKARISVKSIEDDVKDMVEDGSIKSGYPMSLLTKIAYQRYLSSKIYNSVDLPENVLEKLEIFLTKKVRLLISRVKALKSVLIDEDEEIKETWSWGRSDAIKYHMKFLMRQRYMREISVRASLDMAYFDCANILKRNSTEDFYIKSTDLFTGVDLRNVISHRNNIPETIGNILDEDDFPSAKLEKMLMLIDDSEAIESMLKLFPVSGALEEDSFVNWINNAEDKKYEKEIKVIKDCKRWDKYLFLLPFIKA